MDEFYFYTKGLTVGYHGVPLIKNIEICLKRGEILTLIGPNGAGKTTILKSIIRQLKPIAGSAVLDGTGLSEFGGRELSQKMSVVLTDRVRTERMTCADVVATGRYPYTGRFGVLSAKDRVMVREAMDQIRISELAECDFNRISDGQKQRVMLARAVCQEPEIMILDEPTSFLDMKYKLEFLSVLQDMSRSRGLSVIMSLHELDLAGRISDKVACVRGDRIDRFGTPEEIFASGYIAQLYRMTTGSYEERTGNLELPRVSGIPEVFVMAGNGSGTAVYRRLQRAGIPFATGILWENDLDYPIARALAGEIVSVRPFSRIDPAAKARARKLMDSCSQVICTLDFRQSGDFASDFEELYHYAKDHGKIR